MVCSLIGKALVSNPGMLVRIQSQQLKVNQTKPVAETQCKSSVCLTLKI